MTPDSMHPDSKTMELEEMHKAYAKAISENAQLSEAIKEISNSIIDADGRGDDIPRPNTKGGSQASQGNRNIKTMNAPAGYSTDPNNPVYLPVPSREENLRIEGVSCEVCGVPFLSTELYPHKLPSGLVEMLCSECLETTLEYDNLGI